MTPEVRQVSDDMRADRESREIEPAGEARAADPAEMADPAAQAEREQSDNLQAAADNPPKPGDPDFDPGEHKGALGDDFRVGRHDPQGLFDDSEVKIADRLVEEGASVHPRHPDHTVQGKKNPDSMVRYGPEDEGTITEFKTRKLEEGVASDPDIDSAAVRRAVLQSGSQLAPYGGGDAVIDVRGTEMTEETARRGYARAVGADKSDSNQHMPKNVQVILPDNEILRLPEE